MSTNTMWAEDGCDELLVTSSIAADPENGSSNEFPDPERDLSEDEEEEEEEEEDSMENQDLTIYQKIYLAYPYFFPAEMWEMTCSGAAGEGSSQAGKAATDYSKGPGVPSDVPPKIEDYHIEDETPQKKIIPAVQETVYKAPLTADFDKEQEEFIRTKGDNNEEELEAKIMALSECPRVPADVPPKMEDYHIEDETPEKKIEIKITAGWSAKETFRLFEKGRSPVEIMAERDMKRSTILGHLAAMVSNDKKIDVEKTGIKIEDIVRIGKAIVKDPTKKDEELKNAAGVWDWGDFKLGTSWIVKNADTPTKMKSLIHILENYGWAGLGAGSN